MKNTLKHILSRVQEIEGEVFEFIFEPPAKEEDIIIVEKELGLILPSSFRNTLLNVSSQCYFSWSLPDDFELPNPLQQIFSGNLSWDLEELKSINEEKDKWIKEAYPNPENSYDKVWHNKLAFQDVENGDFLAIDLSPQNYGKIVFLSHDDGSGHGVVMAEDFEKLLENWIPLGCPGAEDWQWLPFVKDQVSGIDPNCENAKIWKSLIKL